MFVSHAFSCEQVGDGLHRLIHADVTQKNPMLDSLARQVQCIYADPPYSSGNIFERKRSIGAAEWGKCVKSLTLPSYTDRCNEKEYHELLSSVIHQAYYLLNDTGIFFLHLDWHSSARARCICDDVFGSKMFLNEIIWSYDSGGRTRKFFSRKHDNILMYARSKHYRFDITRVPVGTNADRQSHMRRSVDDFGRYYYSMKVNGKEYRYYEDEPIYPSDVWTDISHLQQRDPERTGFTTQKPLKLVERLMKPVVQPGDIVFDPCCGSGTSVKAAENIGCKAIVTDISAESFSVTTARLESGYSIFADVPESSAVLSGHYDQDSHLMYIDSFALPEKGIEGTDWIEQIRFGRFENGRFTAPRNLTRSHRYPELPLVGDIPQGAGEVAVCLTDAYGTRHLFVWEDLH